MYKRIVKLRENLKSQNLDGVLAYSPENRRYLSGFTGSAGFVVITGSRNAFITDFRYKEQAGIQCEGYEIIIHNNNAAEKIKEIVKASGIRRLGIEEGYMTVGFFEELKALLGGVELAAAGGIISLQRSVKDEHEISCIEKSAAIADSAFSHVLQYIKPGVREVDIALELEFHMKRNGASGLSFDTIAASGERSALPHGRASEKELSAGEFLTLDFGCVYNGYCCDMTRTVFIGTATKRHKEIYDTVYKAQTEALKHIKPGMIGRDIDKVARDIISEAGFGEYFGHSLGHGVGLVGHDEPKLSPSSTVVLQPGMVVTDEPGIYIPGFGGVRIEDLVLVTEKGSKVLSKSTKELLEL